MNTLSRVNKRLGGVAGPAIIMATLFLAGCASSPVAPTGAQEVREKLTVIQNTPAMARHARAELREAEEAVVLAEEPVASKETELGEHRVYMADNKVEVARAAANAGIAEAELVRLDRELAAKRQAHAAQQREAARNQQDMADSAATNRTQQQQIAALGAQSTDRGLELRAVLFEFGSSELSRDGTRNLDQLVIYLNRNQGRRVLIEGHTDSVGSAVFNQGLSERRAETVRRYLNEHGIQGNTLAASGYGLARPVATNSSNNGRQQNRRVQVIVAHR